MADETMNVVFFFFETELVECQCPLVRRHFQQGASVYVDPGGPGRALLCTSQHHKEGQ